MCSSSGHGVTLNTAEVDLVDQFDCPDCEKAFELQSDLNKHLLGMQLTERSYPCDKCSMTFCSSHGLSRHLTSHLRNDTSLHECLICGSSFPEADLRGHMEDKHLRNNDEQLLRPVLLPVILETAASSNQVYSEDDEVVCTGVFSGSSSWPLAHYSDLSENQFPAKEIIRLDPEMNEIELLSAAVKPRFLKPAPALEAQMQDSFDLEGTWNNEEPLDLSLKKSSSLKSGLEIKFVFQSSEKENEGMGPEWLSAFGENENIRVIYAAALAAAENINDETGIPQQIRLVYAEAFGCREDESGQLQLHYVSARPNQYLNNLDGPGILNIEFGNPTMYLVPNKEFLAKENVYKWPRPHQADYSATQISEAALPIQVLEQNMTALAFSKVHPHPDDLPLIDFSRDLQSCMPESERHQHCDILKIIALDKDGEVSFIPVTPVPVVAVDDPPKAPKVKKPKPSTSVKTPFSEQNYPYRFGFKKHYLSQYKRQNAGDINSNSKTQIY